MSHVRKCDRCGEIFSELETGWQTFQATTMIEDDHGAVTEQRVSMDACPACAIKPKRTFEREREALLAGREQEARIAQLEREVGLDNETGTFEK